MSNRLAHRLRRLGAGPDVLVGICLEATNELVIGLLAILKAGSAYLPIDLAYPAERLLFMLSDAQAPLLLNAFQAHQQSASNGGQSDMCGRIVTGRKPLVADEENLSSSATADHLAYVIYTSGTTGKPKGSFDNASQRGAGSVYGYGSLVRLQ